jgi:hypothetical protein
MVEIQRYLGLYSSSPQSKPQFLCNISSSVAALPENPMAHTLLASAFTRRQSANTDSKIESLHTTEPHITAAVPATTGPDDG